MAVITSILGRGELATAGYGIDPLVLSSEERASGHFTAETAAGRTVRVSLPRGTELQDGGPPRSGQRRRARRRAAP